MRLLKTHFGVHTCGHYFVIQVLIVLQQFANALGFVRQVHRETLTLLLQVFYLARKSYGIHRSDPELIVAPSQILIPCLLVRNQIFKF